MEGRKYFSLYLSTTILYLLTFIFEQCLNEDPTHIYDCSSNNSNNMHSPKTKYTTIELLNLKQRAYIAKMDTDTCNQIKNLKIKCDFSR